jgi:hypothetical protein
MTRQAVTKHLGLLEGANLVVTVWRGREKLHYLNPVPIGELAERWIGKYERHRVRALAELKKGLEDATVSSAWRFTAIGKDVSLPSGTSSPQHSTTASAPCSLKTAAAASACRL